AAQRLQIRWLRCYPSAGYLFARELKRRGWKLPLAGVLCASERLYDFQRELFRQVFGCRTFSHYGHYELGALAGYCEHADTYHVLPFYGYAELLDQEGRPVTEPGRVGEIVATSFIARATPIIRYRTGDLAVWGGVGCEACGRPYPIWREVEGRAQEFVVTRDGRLLSNSALIFHNEVYDHIQQFEYYQEEPGVVTFRYIPGPGWNGDTARRTRRLLEEKLQNVALHLAPVERMTLSERGKHGAI
ncbi:MAG: phenylacetate--CoA ligase family protein, partial [Xanthomonadales bacterium]|nr:phenylacetate--CoA ligase family protein [Xanthomonadales bacterium]